MFPWWRNEDKFSVIITWINLWRINFVWNHMFQVIVVSFPHDSIWGISNAASSRITCTIVGVWAERPKCSKSGLVGAFVYAKHVNNPVSVPTLSFCRQRNHLIFLSRNVTKVSGRRLVIVARTRAQKYGRWWAIFSLSHWVEGKAFIVSPSAPHLWNTKYYAAVLAFVVLALDDSSCSKACWIAGYLVNFNMLVNQRHSRRIVVFRTCRIQAKWALVN